MVMAVTILVLLIAIPRARLAIDRVSVQAAASEMVATLSFARRLALASRSTVWLGVDSGGTLRVHRNGRREILRPLSATHGVLVSATRDSIAFDSRGLGWGLANMSIVVYRGAARDTIFVSRLGRVR